MAKNGKLVTDYLDDYAETMRLMCSKRLEDAQTATERIASGRSDELWQACLESGWTYAELEAAFARRFKRPM